MFTFPFTLFGGGNAWDIENALYTDTKYIRDIDENATGLAFSSDGTKVYFTSDAFASDKVYQMNLSTAWDISTATYSSEFVSTGSYSSYNHDMCFSSDGVYLYLIDPTSAQLDRYTLSTPWSITTASYTDSKTITVPPSDTFWKGFWAPTGLKFYALSNSRITTWNVSSAWDSSTLTISSSILTYAYPSNGFMSPDGLKIYLTEATDLKQYKLTTAYDISTAVLEKTKTLTNTGNGSGLYITNDGLNLYVMDKSMEINQYAL